METVKASGMLFHHFHGTYWASIGLWFADMESARDALPRMGEGWSRGEKATEVLVWEGDSAAVEAVKAKLGEYGADVDAIDSLAHSVDHGDEFFVTIPVVAAEQLSLF